MGCTGSKPSLLLSGSSHHNHHHHHHHTNGNGTINSPQKGFILFNSKTIDYLKANESDIKEKLKSRCKGKLNVGAAAGKSSLLNVKRNLLAANTSATLPVSNGGGTGADVAAIESAVDYVLKYAINDFDIENFKSSNQLSMKQIRKDIMKKYSSTSGSRLSASRLLPNSSSAQHSSDTLGAAKTGTLQSGAPPTTYSASYYKSALNTAIDEFGLFIQENFININEFEKKMSASDANQTSPADDDSSKKPDLVNANDTKVKSGETPVVIEPEPSSTNSTESEEALKLKEALELARQNFYKGKVSMVCLTKKGGYVVKEVQSPPNGTQQSPNNSMTTNANSNSNDTADCLSKLEREDKSVSNISVRSINFDKSKSEDESTAPVGGGSVQLQSSKSSSTAISEFLNVKNDLAIVLNETIECIVSYSTKSSAAVAAASSSSSSSSSASASSSTNLINADKSANDLLHSSNNETNHQLADEMQHDKQLKQKQELLFNRANNINNNLIKINNKEAANNENNNNNNTNVAFGYALLKENLEKSKNIIEILNVINENDFHLIDEKLVESTLNLDYVNKEFKSYLILLENSQLQQLEKLNNLLTQVENNNNNNNNRDEIDQLNDMLNKNREIRKCVEQIDKLIGDLPGKLFTSKQLPHPVEVNRTDSVKKQKSSPTLAQTTTTTTTTTTTDEQPAQIIDIKKEIAFSILNVGEVLAKTIDYYSIDPANGQSEELKELIKISETQAAHEKKLMQTSASKKSVTVNGETNFLQVNTSSAASASAGGVTSEQAGPKTTTTVSSTSSLSSPSISSSSSLSQSGSVSPQQQQQHQQQQSAATSEEEKLANEQPKSERNKTDSIQENIAYLVEEMSATQHVNNYLNNCDAERLSSVELILKREDDYDRYGSSTKDSITVDDKTSVEQSTGATGGGAAGATKSSSSSSDILSQDRLEDEDDDQDQDQDDDESHSMVHQYINNIIETATKKLETSTATTTTTADLVVYRNGTEIINTTTTMTTSNGVNVTKRMSLDEELMYQLEDVDKKVKYMNETCSENEDDDDDDELDYMMDPNDDDDDDDDDERLFHPARRPAKIKSELRQNRKIDLHEEIKQISNVIQDLVQTINIRNEVEMKPQQATNQQNNNNGHFQKTKSLNNSQTNGNGAPKKPSINNGNGSGSFSAIPIRQKILTKQKATTVDDEIKDDAASSFKTTIQLSPPSTNLESFVDLSSPTSLKHDQANKSTPGKFKSKLPVKK